MSRARLVSPSEISLIAISQLSCCRSALACSSTSARSDRWAQASAGSASPDWLWRLASDWAAVARHHTFCVRVASSYDLRTSVMARCMSPAFSAS